MGRILVTGGAGFIGSHVADALLLRGHAVTVLDDCSGGSADNVPAGAAAVFGSITDTALVERTFREGRFEHVYHLAAYAAEGLSHFIRRYNYTTNVVGSVNLINAAVNHGVSSFVFASSIAVYGESPALPVSEDTPVCPDDPYGIAKHAVEQDLRLSQAMFGLDYVIFRPHNVFGPRQNIGDRYRNVVGIFMNQILQGRPMTIFGDGSQTRAFSDIDEVAPVMADAVDTPAARNGTFNIGADRPIAVRELAERVAAAMGVEPRIEFLPPRREVPHVHACHARVRRVFGERPAVTLDEGLRRMADWARRHGARTTPPFAEIEIARNLPAIWRA